MSPHWRRDPLLPARIDALLGGDRRLGSRDRRLYRELVYTAVRYLPWVEPLLESAPPEAVRRIAWLAADSPQSGPFRAEVAGGLPDCPAGADETARILGADVDALSPAWLRDECPGAFLPPLREVLLSRAPLWLRLQAGDAGPVFAEFDRLGWKWRRSELLAGAVELAPGTDVARTEAYASGRVEIQDIGSQLILESLGVAPGGHWLDACAGSGGKTLQLAALLGPRGRVSARDVRGAALEELSLRVSRAGLADRVQVAPGADPPGGYDAVLVDAPCTGSGTWRRAPHLKWVTSKRDVRRASELQLRLLSENAPRVKPGGLLAYATCSLCASENGAVAAAFLAGSPGYAAELAGRTFLPQSHNGDGFFAASFRRSLA